MIIDVTGPELFPGNHGKDCPANGYNPENECCCDECPYLLCCTDAEFPLLCATCIDQDCPRFQK